MQANFYLVSAVLLYMGAGIVWTLFLLEHADAPRLEPREMMWFVLSWPYGGTLLLREWVPTEIRACRFRLAYKAIRLVCWLLPTMDLKRGYLAGVNVWLDDETGRLR